MNTSLFDLVIPVSLLQGGGLVCSVALIHTDLVKDVDQSGIPHTVKPVISDKSFISYLKNAEKTGPVIQYFLGDEIRLEPIIEICVEEETRVEPVIQLYADSKSRKEVDVSEMAQVALAACARQYLSLDKVAG